MIILGFRAKRFLNHIVLYLYQFKMLLFNYIEHLYSQTNYIGDVADKITASDWWRCDKLQLADSELGVYYTEYG